MAIGTDELLWTDVSGAHGARIHFYFIFARFNALFVFLAQHLAGPRPDALQSMT